MSTFFEALERATEERVRKAMELSQREGEWRLGFTNEHREGLEQLDRLLGYAKFDLGLYVTVAIILLIAISFEPTVFKFHRGFLSLAVGLVGLAGLAAGTIASRCADFTSRRELWAARIGPFGWCCLTGEYWAYLQHTCFALALLAAVLSVLMGSGRWLAIASCIP